MNHLVISVVLFFNYVQTANILGFFMFPSFSHQIVYQPIWKELSLRGHNVTVVTPNPLNDRTLTNLSEINVDFTYEFVQQTQIEDVLGKELNLFESWEAAFGLLGAIIEAELQSSEFTKLLADKSQRFDLILIECFHPLLYGLAGRFNAPLIGISSTGVPTNVYDNIEIYHFGKKTTNLLFDIWSRYFHHWNLLPKINELAKKYYGDDIPYLGLLQKNQQMLFLNTNPYIHLARPNVPVIVEMSQMHIRETKPLPSDLRKILDASTNGFIYFSLGSNIHNVNIPKRLREVIIDTLSELNYTVIWKWEPDNLPKLPENIIVKEWLPQQDILAHPNIKAFVTQGGLQSMEEAISRGVPLIGMAFMADQSMHVQRIIDLGIGLRVDPVTVTKEELMDSITKVIENSEYKRKMWELNHFLYDKPMVGLQKVIWWSEYVLKYKGAPHLRCWAADISWFDFLLIDVSVVLILLLYIITVLSFKAAKIIYGFVLRPIFIVCKSLRLYSKFNSY